MGQDTRFWVEDMMRAEHANMKALLKRIYDVTSAKDSRGEPEIGGDFKIAVEFLLDIEDELAALVGPSPTSGDAGQGEP